MLASPLAPKTIAAERRRVIATAHAWLGTPFHPAAAVPQVGVDCAHLLIECYAPLGIERPAIEPYAPDWFLNDDAEGLTRFSRWIARYCVAVDHPEPGDIALFRYGRAVSHAAIVIGPETVIHAFNGLGVTMGSLAPTHDLAPRLAGFWTPMRWQGGRD